MKTTEIIDWTIPDNEGNIDVPDELMPLFNSVGMQLRFHTIRGKNEILTIADIVYRAQKFFNDKQQSNQCPTNTEQSEPR